MGGILGNLGGSISDATGNFGSSVSDFIKDPLGTVGDFTESYAGYILLSYMTQGTYDYFILGAAISEPDTPVLKELDSYIDTLAGEKNRAAEDIANMQKQYGVFQEAYTDEQLRLIAFDEIFQMALENKFGAKLEIIESEIQKMIKDYKQKYGWVDRLQDDFAGKIAYTAISIIGGFNYDFSKAATGDWDAIKRVLSYTIQAAIAAFLIITPGFQGLGATMLIGLAHQLQVQYANSALTKFVFQMLDFVFDTTGANKAFKELQIFDKDSDYYEEAINNANLGMTIAVMIATLGSGVDASSVIASTAGGKLAAVYEAYNMAMLAGNLVEANAAKMKLEKTLEDMKQEQMERDFKLQASRMLTQSRDLSYILQGYETMYNKYILEVEVGESEEWFDPSAIIPLNTRYKKNNLVDFGFDDVLHQYSENNFYENMIYGTSK